MKIINPQTDYTLTAPVQYINRRNILDDCGDFILKWGKKAVISGGKRAYESIGSSLFDSLDRSGIKWQKYPFAGECCDENISFILEKVKEFGADIIIGVGGGKSLDTAKAAAEMCNLPVVCIPTIAATCAASSALSVVYNSKGEFTRDYYLTKNANLVLVDSDVIAKAPVEYFISGVLDSISKWYEGDAALSGIKEPDIFTISAVKLAYLLNETMESKATKAIQSVRNGEVCYSMMAVTDLNIYTAGVIQSLGQASVRAAAAHSIHNGLSVIHESHNILHGLKVGYGIVVQLFMLDFPLDEIARVIRFFRELELEPSFKGLNLPFEENIIRNVAERSVIDPSMIRMPYKVGAEHVISGMKKLEKFISEV